MAKMLLPISRHFELADSSSGAYAEVPEDGFDDDSDEELWVVRKTFLELKSESSLVSTMPTMRSYKSEPSTRRLSLSPSNYDEPMYISDATCSTCDSSSSEEESQPVLVRNVSRQKSVTFSPTEEVHNLSSEGSIFDPRSRAGSDASICSIRTANSPMYRARRISTDSHASILSIKTAESSFFRTRVDSAGSSQSRGRNDSTASVLSIQTDYSGLADEHSASMKEDATNTSGSVCPASMCTMAPLVAAPLVILSPCAFAMPAAKPTPAVPSGNVCGPPGDFSSKAEFTKQQEELKELATQQRLLEEQRARLLGMSGGMQFESTPSLQQPPGNWGQQSLAEEKSHERTTVVLRNLPDGFSRAKIEELLNSQGLAKKFNFIYAPVKFEMMRTIGYAFVNFVSPEAAQECHMKLNGFNGWSEHSEDACHVIWGEKDQGLAAVVERHRNSPVMHPSVLEEFKPAIYNNGAQVPFPAPTKKIRPPRTQRYKNELSALSEVADI